MPVLYVGADVSKGYADFCITDAEGRRLPGSGRYDDTAAGHAAVRQALQHLVDREAPASVHLEIGLEASGGLERNWYVGLRSAAVGASCRVYQLNPLAVRRFLEQRLHHSVTDARSAAGIAAYLRCGERQRQPEPSAEGPDLTGPLVLYRCVCQTIDRSTSLQNELQALLPSVHPELVRYCRQGLPEWVLRLLLRYPTAPALARARETAVAGIPYVSVAKARDLINAAKTSVAALRQPEVGTTIEILAREILRHEEVIAAYKKQLIATLADDPVGAILRSLPGVGAWTAVVLRLEIGDFARFHSAAALVAYAGLDPRYHQSGDGTKSYHISKRGRREIRAALYMNVLTALRGEGVLRAFYDRLLGRRACHHWAVTACMAKLLRIAYACVLSGEAFDPTRHAVAAPNADPSQAPSQHPASTGELPKPEPAGLSPQPDAPSPQPDTLLPTGALCAPVSRREARRRAAARPQAGANQRVRGPGAALSHHTSSAGRVAAKNT